MNASRKPEPNKGKTGHWGLKIRDNKQQKAAKRPTGVGECDITQTTTTERGNFSSRF